MKTYEVAVDVSYYGVITVEAESEEQALKLAEQRIDEEDMPRLEAGDGYDLEILP